MTINKSYERTSGMINPGAPLDLALLSISGLLFTRHTRWFLNVSALLIVILPQNISFQIVKKADTARRGAQVKILALNRSI